jgi:hypothetical protein
VARDTQADFRLLIASTSAPTPAPIPALNPIEKAATATLRVRNLRSGEGQGATFTVKLPIRAVMHIVSEAAARQLKADKVIPFVRSAALADVRALVVGDQADARELLTTVLSQYGADTTAVASTAEAIETLDRWQPNVLDLRHRNACRGWLRPDSPSEGSGGKARRKDSSDDRADGLRTC